LGPREKESVADYSRNINRAQYPFYSVKFA